MTAAECWGTYVSCVLGVLVEDAENKFRALSEQEQAAWEAVAALKQAK